MNVMCVPAEVASALTSAAAMTAAQIVLIARSVWPGRALAQSCGGGDGLAGRFAKHGLQRRHVLVVVDHGAQQDQPLCGGRDQKHAFERVAEEWPRLAAPHEQDF